MYNLNPPLQQTQTAQLVHGDSNYIHAPSTALCRKNEHYCTSVSELGYLFLTSPVCNRIVSDLDVKDHTVSGWLSLDDVKSYNTNRDLLLYKNILMRSITKM